MDSLWLLAVVFLGAALLFVPLAKKAGIGSILGYLAAGIVIGPSVLGLIGIKEGEEVLHFSEFGVVLMLFIIGLELEPKRLWNLRASILGLGGLQVLLTMAATYGVCVSLGIDSAQSIVIGMIISLSSTAIVLQSLAEKNLMDTNAGQKSFTVLLFQDLAIIPMLALLPFFAGVETIQDSEYNPAEELIHSLPDWGYTLLVVGSFVIVFLMGKYIFNPFLHFVAKSRLRELFTASSLFIVISMSVLMATLGLSPALGAFLAGVVLANSEFKHELEGDIAPFKGLLLGLFFMSVGTSMNLSFIYSNVQTISLILLAVIVGKALILFILGKFFKLKLDQNLLFSLILCQLGEFGFLLISFSAQNNILSNEYSSIFNAVIALSMAITPFILLANERFIQPYFGTKKDFRPDDKIELEQPAPVIIAGFGRFGSVAGRFLRAHDIGTTILDHDSDRVDSLRKLGFKVFYGDATKQDLLRAAGAEKAKLIIVALDDPLRNLKLIKLIKTHFSHLHIYARAHDHWDTFDLMDLGVLNIYRETTDTALRLGSDVMKCLGHNPDDIGNAIETFIKYDDKLLKELSSHKQNNSEYVAAAKEKLEALEDILRQERNMNASDNP